jgi:hypothetical protein
MSTITDQTTIHEDQSTKNPGTEPPARTVHDPSTTKPRRTALRWVGGGIAIVAAAFASVLMISDEHTPAKDVDATGGADHHEVTELDVRGIPTWWSRQGGTPRSEYVTALDVRGVPIWWSSGASAPQP